ncbi:MAG: PGPGW domain-containing protein [Desulfobacterales bacterium]|jgi:uncharacterized protein (TIGR02611 family)|nr:PGPGW domain-containing protein [Desulfobacterales bacterium]
MTALFLKSLRQVKKVIIAVVGFTVLAIGLVMIVLPGPAFIVIPAALGILSTDFAWAKNLVKKVRSKIPKTSKIKGGSSHGIEAD